MKLDWIDIYLIWEVSAWTLYLNWSFDSDPEPWKVKTLSVSSKCLKVELYWIFIGNLNVLEEIEYNK